MSAIYYLTQQDLDNAWGAQTMLALFDDTDTNTLNTTAIQAVISRASVRVTAKLPHNYDGTIPLTAPIPELIKDAALEYAWAFALPRNRDFMAAIGVKDTEVIRRGDDLMKEVHTAVARLYDAPSPTPTNVGGAVGTIGTTDPAPPPAVFANMGDW